MQEEKQSGMLSADQAHALLGKGVLSRRAFYNALNKNEIPNRRVGKRILIPRHAFQEWLQTGKQTVAA
jgi:excisionase family DNA binding protein